MRINDKKIKIKHHLFGKFDGIDPPLRRVSKGRSGKILATNEVPGFVPLLRLVKYSEEDSWDTDTMNTKAAIRSLEMAKLLDCRGCDLSSCYRLPL